MKSYFLLICLIIGYSITAQTYYPLPESGAVWNRNGNVYCPNVDPLSGVPVKYSIVLAGDTLINGISYHKLVTPYYYAGSLCTTDPPSYDIYQGAIRQDVTAKKVYIYPKSGANSEKLLYDFTLEKGDTVRGYLALYTGTNPGNANIVESIDSVLVGGVYHKRWLLNKNYNAYLIEGVGCTYGLISPLPPKNTADAPMLTILCFKVNEVTVYPANATDCKIIVTSLNEEENKTASLAVFPNPSQGSFTISYTDLIKEIQVHDVLGKEILKKQPDQASSFELNGLEKGTYILTFVDKYNRISRKKIIRI